MIDIRKLAAVDTAWLGPRITIVEYATGVLFPLALGVRSLRAGWPGLLRSGWVGILGVWLIGIGLNYIPLLIYAVLIARRGTVQQEAQPELANARRYGIQQVVILVPLMVLVLAMMQEARRPR